MGGEPTLSDEQEKELLRKCWYTHDARWFMSVAQEFGLEAANRLNKRTCRALGEAEMRRFVKALGIAAPTNDAGAGASSRGGLSPLHAAAADGARGPGGR